MKVYNPKKLTFWQSLCLDIRRQCELDIAIATRDLRRLTRANGAFQERYLSPQNRQNHTKSSELGKYSLLFMTPLTKEMIENMEPGREMDVLVAERIMELQCFQEVRNNGVHVYQDWYHSFHVIGLPEVGEHTQRVSEYSEDIKAAFEVVEKTKLLEEYVLSFQSGEWVIALNDVEMEHGEYYPGLSIRARATTPPLVICRAALMNTL